MSIFLFTNFSSELKKNILGMWYKTTYKTMITFYFFFESNFIEEKDNLLGQIIITEEELDSVDVDSIGNVEDEERENHKAIVNGGALTRNINKKKKPVVIQIYRCPLCDKCTRRPCFFNIHAEYCELVR